MFGRFSDVLQSAADVLAPPATRLEDFEYHWKLILNFYQGYDDSSKVQVEETRIPHHLNQMLQLIVDEEKEQQGGTVGPCLEAIVQRSICLLDGLTAMAASDRPPGARALALSTGTSLLRRTKQPCVNSAHVYRPLQRMLVQCNESPASPTEKEEVELLLTLCGLVRKEPGLANIFTTPYVEDKESLLSIPEDIQKLIKVKPKIQTPRKNPLFVELPTNPLKSVSIIRTSSSTDSVDGDSKGSQSSQKTVYEENDKFLLIDLLLSYLNSADNQVVLRACEGIMIVSSLPDAGLASLLAAGSCVCESLVDQLCDKYRAIPASVETCDVDHLNITWGYVAQEFGDKSHGQFHGGRELTAFFSWLDYCDTLMKECHPSIAIHLARTFRQHFLEATVECGLRDLHHTVVVTSIVGKCLKVVDSPELINEFTNWLVGEGEMSEWPLLHRLINNCLTDQHELTLETLRFFETIIEKPTEHSIHRLVLARLSSRGYLAAPQAEDDEGERDRLNDVSLGRERERNREAMQQLQHEGLVSGQVSHLLAHEGLGDAERDGEDIHRVINSFLLLLPRALQRDPLGADYEQYIHDAARHYQIWLDTTSSYSWPTDPQWVDNTASSTHSYDSRPEVDIHLDDAFDKPTNYTYKQRNSCHFDRNNLALALNRNCGNGGNEKLGNSGYTSGSNCYSIEKDSLKGVNGENQSSTNGNESYNVNESFASNASYNGGTNSSANGNESCTDNCVRNCDTDCVQPLVMRSRDVTSSPDVEEFDEGPFFRMIFKLLSEMPSQPYQVNLHLTSIISKLALMPHPNLHEFLLNPTLSTSRNTRTLFKTLQELARRLTVEIPKLKNYKQLVENTRLQLMSEDPAYDCSGEHNQLVESLIVLEEFCKELAAVAFVKYQHAVHCR